ncbi:PREDICTED: FERM and PDZ domain-containing protein 1 [Nanorana parkeri]|uniref:FERM and PDZ domain-containing protein 1 n=1 Tax=Nanorana parkeri TaxID=125878 RepID=UPI00085465E5|nr:PREDICTED: FERM and PDZ domain-containing protein 1 [Nanorana parkeri]
MEDPDTHLIQIRKGHRIEQMVVRWLRRSRDNSSRARVSTGEGPPIGPNQYGCSLKLTIEIKKDAYFENYGFDISPNLPLTVTVVNAGGPAEGKLLAGDQISAINNESVENIHVQEAADMIRDSVDNLNITVFRSTSSPKSSFLTAEKRAKLKSNPVKVRFAEEVIVNGHTQGNSILFMPNVLKVYLENGQTKAFKFEKKTTVKDIIMTLKEKLSINVIEHFALVLEEQYNISKLYLLHEEELMEQVVQKRESHDYRCLFRVCFVPKDPFELLQEDPVAFEYLYLQSCSDVLQERFAMEMKCSVALRLAALHIQERIHTCGQSQKISFKYIEKDWGIDNFLSPTLLRNMRGKDIKKAISFHIKRNQCVLEPRQKQPVSAAQIRVQYLKILGDLKTYGGKIFHATLMLQDRESYVTLLVGAKYGISQIINNKLNIMITLAEFSNISRIELTSESEKVSLIKVYLQDVKPLSLLLESNNAKDIACLISGYCKLQVCSAASIFEWCPHSQVHRVSTEEGYESRACSDSEESSELDSSLDHSSELQFLRQRNIKPLPEEEEEEEEDMHMLKQDEETKESAVSEKDQCDCGNNDTDSISEASDSANTESQGYKISWSSDSIDALEEDDLETCSSSRPEFFQFYTPILNDVTTEDQGVFTDNPEMKCKGDGCEESDPLLCFLQMADIRENSILDTKEKPRSPKDADCREDHEIHVFPGCQLIEKNVMEYYSLCSNVSPASSVDRNIPSSPESNCVKDLITECKLKVKGCRRPTNKEVEGLILDPPPGFGDSSSEEEFFDAADRFTPTLTSPGARSETSFVYPESASNGLYVQNSAEKCRKEKQTKKPSKMLRKRRSYLQTDYTSQVTFPLSPSNSLENIDHVCCFEKESHLPTESHSPTVSSLNDIEAEPALLEMKPLSCKPILKSKSRTHSPSLMEMEPDTMENKSVTESLSSSISAIRFKCDSGVTDSSPNAKYCVYECINVDKTPNGNMSEQNGRASPSEISLELDNTDICGLSHVSLVLDDQATKGSTSHMENITEDASAVFENIFKSEGVKEENISSVLSSFPSNRILPYIAQSEASWQSKHDTLKMEFMNSEVDISPKGAIDNESSPQSSKTQKLFSFSDAGDLLFDFKGIDDLFTNFPINSFKEGGAEATKVPPCEEAVHLLIKQEPDFLTSLDPTDVTRSSNERWGCLSPSVCYSETAVDTLELCYEESNEKIESCAETLSSDEGSDGHSMYKENCISEAQSFIPKCTDSASKGCRQKEVLENRCVDLYDSEQKSPDISKVGNCSCHLSYANCFRPIDNDAEDEIIDFAGTASPLPRTIPPRSGNSVFVENIHLSTITAIKKAPSLEHCEALDLLKARIHDSPMGFGKLQDIVLDLQRILEEYKNKRRPHLEDKCAALFSEHKSSLCIVSRNVMSASQKVLRPNQTPEEIYQVVEETFFSLVHMTDVCLQFSSCVKCNKRQTNVQTNLCDLICTYHQFVQAAKKAAERNDQELHLKLLSRQCTALTAAVFCLTQQFRTLLFL